MLGGVSVRPCCVLVLMGLSVHVEIQATCSLLLVRELLRYYMLLSKRVIL